MAKKNSRRSERSLAFQVLYTLFFSPVQSEEELKLVFQRSPDLIKQGNQDENSHSFAFELVHGVWSHEKELDEVIAKYSHNWRVDRMGCVERTILRISLYEIIYRDDIPNKVAINEAIELSNQYGEASARTFLNGILDAIAKNLQK